jgi:uncharacterized FAD-dependent dehydrogenase
MNYTEKIIIIGSGVAGINTATELVDNGYPGELITIIDKGKDPYKRKSEEVMTGMLGAGGWSDGKLTYHTSIGGQLSKYCGEEEAYKLMDKVILNFTRFHPKPKVIMKSDPKEEPDFIKPYFNLRLFPVYHIGSNYLHQIAKKWYNYLLDKKVNFIWDTEVEKVHFEKNSIFLYRKSSYIYHKSRIEYDKLIIATGKSGIDFTSDISKQYELPTEPKSTQIGVRFEAPQKYFQKLIDISYDFKLYQKFDDVSIRSFCTNNNAAFVAVEETYGDISYNGHAIKDPSKENQMTNFGILMEIKGIENPFEWSRKIVNDIQSSGIMYYLDLEENNVNLKQKFVDKLGLFYSPNSKRSPSNTLEGDRVLTKQIENLDKFKEIFGKYSDYIIKFIEDLQKIFPEMKDDWGIYIPEVKYLNPEPLVNYNDLSLIDYKNVYFIGDALSARGITISGAQGIYVAKSIINN